METSRCSVVLLQPTPIVDLSSHPLFSLQSLFHKVQPHTNTSEAIAWIQQQTTPTLVLVDIDTVSSPLPWIQRIQCDLGDLVRRVPIIVSCSNESPEFMVECLDAGAADYLLKPLQPQVIKTLFLRLCSHSTGKSRSHISPPSSGLVSTATHHRIKHLLAKDDVHIQAIMETHLPCVSQNNYRPPSKERTALLKQQISNWEFFPIDLDPEDLIFCVVFIFEQVFLCPELAYPSVTQADLYHFILDLSKTYHDQNSYHNFAHAVDVLQSTYYMLCSLGVLTLADRSPSPPKENPTWPQSLLRPKDVFALLIAAIGHDAAHPGVSNIFMINSATPLALLYNDSSVLESFHAMTLFQVMKRHGFDQLAGGAGSPEYQEFRKRVITSILATDMAHHADYVTKIKEQAVRLHSTPLRSMDEATCEKERLLLCSAIIKCADISNVARPYRLAIKWAELLTEEFACQGDLERELSMPVLPFNDREKIILEDSQIGFIQYVAMDLFSSVAGVMHEITFAVKQMQQNLKQWQNRKSVLHDSGVSSLGDTDDSVKDVIHPEVEYSKSPVTGYHMRLSMDKKNSDGLFTKLPSMPAVAMSDYGNHGTINAKSFSYRINHFQEASTIDNWPIDRSSGPAHCQCVLQ